MNSEPFNKKNLLFNKSKMNATWQTNWELRGLKIIENSLLKAVPGDLLHYALLMNPKRWTEQVFLMDHVVLGNKQKYTEKIVVEKKVAG